MAGQNVEAFKKSAAGDIPILQDSVNLAEHDPRLVAKRFITYYKIIKDLFDLTPGEVETITRVNQELESKRGADNFLEKMQTDKEKILEGIRQMGDTQDPDNLEGVKTLTRMMRNAWEKKQADKDWIPEDGKAGADQVIWGFVNEASRPEIDRDFTICHGIERVLTQLLGPNEFTGHKDWLLCAMNDVVALRGLRGQGREAEVLDLWSTPRPNGLGWVSSRRLEAYKKALGK